MQRMSWLAAMLAAVAVPSAAAQEEQPVVRDLPENLQPFWKEYWPAKQADDEEAMDKAVRLHRQEADWTLNLLLDDWCGRPVDALPDELRTLAWSLDRVDRGTRFIERVRFVLDLEPAQRLQRLSVMNDMYLAEEDFDGALTSTGDEAWARVADQFGSCAASFEKLGDLEFAVRALNNVADVELRRNRQWERAVALQHMVELAGRLPFKDAAAEGAVTELERLRALGFDPSQPKPDPSAMPVGGDAAPAADANGGGPGRTLDSFAAGAGPVTVRLAPDAPKKGLAPVVLPGFFPLENHFLWTYSWLEGDGPTAFDTQRSVFFAPGGKRWQLLREGFEFFIDADGDGQGDATISPSSTPQRIEVPLGDGRTWPVMACLPGDQEQQFGMELNYAPTPTTARVRFNIAGGMRGEVLGESWLVLDSNMTGTYGDLVDQWGDGFTATTPELETWWHDPDAVQVGKGKVALPFSSVMPVGGAFYRASITPDGAELTLRKLDLATGQVKLDCATKVPPTHVLIEEVGGSLPAAILNVVPAKKGGSVTVPAGSWRLAMARLESGTKTGLQQVRVYRGRSQAFSVEPGKTTTLALGAPYQLRFRPAGGDIRTEEGETTITFGSLRVFGRGGEEYAQCFDESLQPEVEILGADGKKLVKGYKTLRADLELWTTAGERCLYVPAPIRVSELKDTAKLEFRLAQKSHGLLGGPFASEPAAEKPAGKP
jgi:hypothetical protein